MDFTVVLEYYLQEEVFICYAMLKVVFFSSVTSESLKCS